MRRLILEMAEEEFPKHSKKALDLIKSYEILHLLRFEKEEFAAIIRIEFKDQLITIDDLLRDEDPKKVKIQLLEEDKIGRKTFFIAGQFQQNLEDQVFKSFGGYLSSPFEIRDGKIRIAFLGDQKQLKRLLKIGDELGVHYKVVSLTDAKFSFESPLKALTDKQREVFVSAFTHGYYESPKKISNRELAEKLGLKVSTFVQHRRKAEHHLLSEIMEK